MNPLSPQTRAILKRLDTALESKIPVSDIPRTTVGEPIAVAAEASPLPAAVENPVTVIEQPVAPEAAQSLESQPELLPLEPVVSVPAEPDVIPSAPVAAAPHFVEPKASAAQAELPQDLMDPPMEDEPGPVAKLEQREDEISHGGDEDAPPPRDEDNPPPRDEEFINFDDVMMLDQSPVINDPGQDMPPRRRPEAPPSSQPGQRPFPPTLEPKRWYRMLLDDANRPIAIVDHSRDKAVHNYAIPPDRLTFKIDLSSVVQGAAATFRSPLPVSELADRMEGKKFCFECQPGADGNEVVMKLLATEPSLDGKEPKEEILRSKVFKGPKGSPSMSSLPALTSGHQPFSMAAPSVPGKKDLGSQMQWLAEYQARQRGKRV